MYLINESQLDKKSHHYQILRSSRQYESRRVAKIFKN
jgi:hypothetical protein